MSKSLLDEMQEENVRLGCRCWDPPRDPNEIGHLEECPALAHKHAQYLNRRDALKAERDRAVALLREYAEAVVANEVMPRLTERARAFLAEVDHG